MNTNLDINPSKTYSESPLPLIAASSSLQVAAGINSIAVLPDEVMLNIFSFLQPSALLQFSSVSKTFDRLAKDNFLWHTIAISILFPKELAAKHSDMLYKDFCKEFKSITKVITLSTNDSEPPTTLFLKPRDSEFVGKVKAMQLPQIKILSPSETMAICQKDNIPNMFLNALSIIPHKSLTLNHAAQQQLGKATLDLINCTEHIIHFLSDTKILMDNKEVPFPFRYIAHGHHQFLFCLYNDNFYIFYGDDFYNKMWCKVEELKHENLTHLAWEIPDGTDSDDLEFIRMQNLQSYPVYYSDKDDVEQDP